MVLGDNQTFYTAFKAVQADFWICSSSITIPQSHLGKEKKKGKKKQWTHKRKKNRNPRTLGSISRRDVQSVHSPPLVLLGSCGVRSTESGDTTVLATTSFTHSGMKPSFKTPTQHVTCQYHHSKLCGCVWVSLGLKCHRECLGCRTKTLRQLVHICLRQRFEFVQVQPVPLNLWPHLFTLLQKSTARSNSWWQSHVFFH